MIFYSHKFNKTENNLIFEKERYHTGTASSSQKI